MRGKRVKILSDRWVCVMAAAMAALLLAACENSGGVNVMGDIGRPEGAPVASAATGNSAGLNPDGSPNLSKVMTINFADARWDEGRVPKGEQCSALGGKGATPMLSVNGVPKGTSELRVSYQATSGGKLTGRGDMGVLAYKANGAANMLVPSVAGESANVSGARIVTANKGGDKPGYLPPCTRGAAYSVTVQALSGSGQVLATKTVSLGKFSG